jgi:hypothetical protein
MRLLDYALLLAIAVVIVRPEPAASDIYEWRISKSSTDPYVNFGNPNGSLDTLFLWLSCTQPEGMSAAEMTLETIPAGQVLAFNVMNGYLNAGDATNLLLAVGGCPEGPIVAGSILFFHIQSLSVCLTGANVTVDCSLNPQAWPHDFHGYHDSGEPLCINESSFICESFSIESQSWGNIKSLYR